MPERIDGVVDWILSKVGCGYVYGATGWICSAARRRQQAEQYPEYENVILNVCKKWDGKQCFDCAQLVRWALDTVGIKLVSGATSQWRQSGVWAEKGNINTLPKNKLCILWRVKDASTMQMKHVGFLLPDGTTVDARGSYDGVIRSNRTAYPWTHWAIPKGMYKEGQEEGEDEPMIHATVTAKTGKTVNLRNAASKSGKVLVKVPLGETVGMRGAANGWASIEWNHYAGFMMTDFLKSGDTITNAEANELVEELALYREKGSKSLQGAIDALIAALTAEAV